MSVLKSLSAFLNKKEKETIAFKEIAIVACLIKANLK